MWNTISFRSCPDAFFQYKFDNDMFMIKCELYSPSLTGGRVCVHGDGARCELGSLKCDRGLLLLERTYPVSFLHSNGIDKETITHFSIETSDGNIILSYPLDSFDNTLDNAQKILDSMKVPAREDDAKKFSSQTKDKIKRLKKEPLTFLPGFEWYRVDDVKETFSLSAIRHIICTPSFMQSFEKSGFWYVGYKEDDDLFAVCIKSEETLPNPMENAIDCCVSFETDTGKYYLVGIGLFDDGQYFVRL